MALQGFSFDVTDVISRRPLQELLVVRVHIAAFVDSITESLMLTLSQALQTEFRRDVEKHDMREVKFWIRVPAHDTAAQNPCSRSWHIASHHFVSFLWRARILKWRITGPW